MATNLPASAIEVAAKSWYRKASGASIHFDYEDAINEAWVIALEHSKDHDPDKMSLEGYLYQRIAWRLSNKLHACSRDFRNRNHRPDLRISQSDEHCWDILELARQRLSQDAYSVLSGQITCATIARQRGIPSRTVSRHISLEIAAFRSRVL